MRMWAKPGSAGGWPSHFFFAAVNPPRHNVRTSVLGAHDPRRDSGMNSRCFTSATAACDTNVAVVIAKIAVARAIAESVAQYRGASSECLPAAVGDRLPLSVGGKDAARADASAWVLSLDFDRHLRRRHRVGSIWWGLGTAVTTNADFQFWKPMRCGGGRLCPLP
jgi:hypothetical protein